MHRKVQVFGCIAIVLGVSLAFRVTRSSSPQSRPRTNLPDTIHSALANPVEFVTNRLTGGIGIGLGTDPVTGFPMITELRGDSPADKAGLRNRDLIVQVDGLPTKGKSLAQVAEQIRGFTGSKVTLTVQRVGSTNVECVIRRSSWNHLLQLNHGPFE